ncbi:hypothetical protein HK097_006735 [Rhizophlyctis rosea]|uniref:Ubiquitin-like protease family profile domain-containing protein n=1 Tax=Rhizophlyctis rosea TaxID=64517 RepID=A0AAD5SCG9_9FUNG|nr:hypothetical protein HK097_006735 [Rhizophlyctis rosea]
MNTYRPLSYDESEILRTEMASTDVDETIRVIDHVRVTRRHLQRLRPYYREEAGTSQRSYYLSDEIINTYLALLSERAAADPTRLGSVFLFNSYLYSRLVANGYKFENVSGFFAEKGSPFDYEFVLLPISEHFHWTIFVIQPRIKQICYYDSLKYSNPKRMRTVKAYLDNMHRKHHAGKGIKWSEWKEVVPKDFPTQPDAVNCGVFVLSIANYTLQKMKIDIDLTRLNDMRRIINYQLIMGGI